MTVYNTIRGLRVKYLSADPANPENGQVWYNAGTGNLRLDGIIQAGSWSSGGALPAARSTGAGFGIQTAAVYAGGQTPPGPGSTVTVEYDGTNWTAGGDLSAGRYEIGGTTAGTLTAGLVFGGNASPGYNATAATEEYNGSSWTGGGNMATTITFMGGSGVQTAAFSAGGRTPSNSNNSQEYNGSSWTNGNTINTTRQALIGMGTQAAGIIAGGEAPNGGSNASETYNGNTWTNAPNMGTARYRLSGSGSVATACLIFGGRFNPPAADKAQTEEFDGTSWTEKADLATARQQLSGNRGTSTSALAVGGIVSGQVTNTEEFTGATTVVKNISVS